MKFVDQVFTNTDVTLDYNEFINCTFGNRSRIHFCGGQYQLTDCKIDGEIGFALHDSAHRTLVWLKFIRSLPNGLQILEDLLRAVPSGLPPMTLN
jgi:hypothetical protein